MADNQKWVALPKLYDSLVNLIFASDSYTPVTVTNPLVNLKLKTFP